MVLLFIRDRNAHMFNLDQNLSSTLFMVFSVTNYLELRKGITSNGFHLLPTKIKTKPYGQYAT